MSRCRYEMMMNGALVIPRSCLTCGLGPCHKGLGKAITPPPLTFSGEVTGCRTVGDKTIVEVLVDEPSEVVLSWQGKRVESREAQQ